PSVQPMVSGLEEILTSPGMAIGSVAYMSPEQVRGEELDARTDLFSFGIVLYEMATGRLPFSGGTSGAISSPILHDSPISALDFNPGLPIKLEEIIKKALEKDREVRYQFASELGADLKRLKRDSFYLGSDRHDLGTIPVKSPAAIAPVESANAAGVPAETLEARPHIGHARTWSLRLALVFGLCLLLAGATIFIYKRAHVPASTRQRALRRVTFDDGLQIGATWSPDGRYLAYSSNRGGKFDIWVQQVSGGDAIQITRGPGHHWQPDWSPDGKLIAYRSESGDGGLFVVPALGGTGLERRIAPFGCYPRWSPNASQILFQTTQLASLNRIYVVDIDGSAPREIPTESLSRNPHGIMWNRALSVAWHPDGKRASIWLVEDRPGPSFWTVPIAGGTAVESAIPPDVAKQFGDVAVGSGRQEWGLDARFSWGPSGEAIYFERTFRGARNIWKMTVDPNTLQPSAIERMTTGPGLDTDLAVSADGRMAFTVEDQHIRAWRFPFDANRGRVTGAGEAITSSGIEVTGLSLTRDGKKLAFSGNRGGKWDLWEKSPVDSREAPFVA